MDKIVVKIGTESLFGWENGDFGGEKVERLCADIAHIIRKTSSGVALVTSGAVGFGKRRKNIEQGNRSLDEIRQYHASLGQKELLKAYDSYLEKLHVESGQILLTHADIEETPGNAASIRNLIEMHMENGTLPIINENDAVSTEEVRAIRKGADNDQNALLIADLIGARALFIITNTNGVYRDKDNSDSRIERIKHEELSDGFITKITGGKSSEWTGGMYNKLKVAREASQKGIETYIIDGKYATLWDYYNQRYYGGTTILPKAA